MPKSVVARAKSQRWRELACVILLLFLLFSIRPLAGVVQGWVGMPEDVHVSEGGGASLSGRLLDPLGEPVHDANVRVVLNGDLALAVEGHSQQDGSYVLDLPPVKVNSASIDVQRAHYQTVNLQLDSESLSQLGECASVRFPDIEMTRRITPGFWVATLCFVLVLLLIALEKLHKTTAALLGVAVVLAVSVIGGAIRPDLFIYSFDDALGFVDFGVIFLVMGMMIVIAVIEATGIFQWVAYQAYRLSKGRIWVLVTILMVVTALASALLDNVTTMLLMTPITIQIALTLGLNPLLLLIPEVLASNVGGISTLIGTPTNILIGSYAGLGFNDFLISLTPGVLMAMLALIIFTVVRDRKKYSEGGNRLSDAMRERLKEAGQITKPEELRKAGVIFGVMLLLFVAGDAIHMVPAVTAILGAVAMLLWVAPDVEEMLKVVDWTTLMFFIALFMSVGALEEVGLISVVATGIGNLVGDNLTAAVLVIVWSAALLSGVIDNIPFAATMLPVVGYLSRTIPGAETNVLWYALSIGAAMGGNTTLIGSSPNLVTAGISERAGYRISYMAFLRVGLPATLVTVLVGTAWLLIRF